MEFRHFYSAMLIDLVLGFFRLGVYKISLLQKFSFLFYASFQGCIGMYVHH